MGDFTVKAWDMGINYIGICCSAGILLTLLLFFNYLMGLFRCSLRAQHRLKGTP